MIENTSTTIQLINPQSGRVKHRHFVMLLFIFLLSIASLCTVYILFPKIDSYVSFFAIRSIRLSFSVDQDAFRIPKTIDDAKILGNILYKYSKHHRYIIMIAFFLTYIL